MKNESFPNKTIYSSFRSVEATDLKNVIWNKIHLARIRSRFWGHRRPKFQDHLVIMTFHYRIFIVFVFDKISEGIKKELGEYFLNDYIFEISRFYWSKCTIECAICLTLILKSNQVRCVLSTFYHHLESCILPCHIFWF